MIVKRNFHTFVSFLYLITTVHKCLSQNTKVLDFQQAATCNTEDLNHSILVECNDHSCKYDATQYVSQNIDKQAQIKAPRLADKVYFAESTRNGKRLNGRSEILPYLNYYESEANRLFDINTTVYVKINRLEATDRVNITLKGARFNSDQLLKDGGRLDHLANIMTDFYGSSPQFSGLNSLILQLTQDTIDKSQESDLLRILDELIWSALGPRGQQKSIKLILDLQLIKRDKDIFSSLRMMCDMMKELKALYCSGVILNEDWARPGELSDSILSDFEKVFGTSKIYYEVKVDDIPDWFRKGLIHDHNVARGLFIKMTSTPERYNILGHLRKVLKELELVVVSSDRPRIVKHGDWANAQDHVIQLKKCLDIGATGFVEDSPFIDLEDNEAKSDALIYSLRQTHGLHYKGPLFYGMGHFSRYLDSGAQVLKTDVITQQNMFAAQFQAFVNPSGEIVVLAFNDNEHSMSFRVAVNEKLITAKELDSKSFNTILYYPDIG